ncbi:MAG: hypothetical protein WCV80_01475 [Candidatus Paceibacterota bacterium]|jgi:hypothetical protein
MKHSETNLKATLPCIHCGKEIEVHLYASPLHGDGGETLGYQGNKNGGRQEVICTSCGTKQLFGISISVEKCGTSLAA